MPNCITASLRVELFWRRLCDLPFRSSCFASRACALPQAAHRHEKSEGRPGHDARSALTLLLFEKGRPGDGRETRKTDTTKSPGPVSVCIDVSGYSSLNYSISKKR